MPARKRAVSFAAADSKLRAGAALKLSMTAIKAVAAILGTIPDMTLSHWL